MHAQIPCSQGQGSITRVGDIKNEKEATLKRLSLAGRATSSRPAISVDEILTRSSVMFHDHNITVSSWVRLWSSVTGTRARITNSPTECRTA